MTEVWILYRRDLNSCADNAHVVDAEPVYASRVAAAARAKELAGDKHVVWPAESPEYFTDEYQHVWKYHPSVVYWAASVEVVQ